MGFFRSLFGGKRRTNVEKVPDHIWMTTDAKFDGLAKDIASRSSSDTVAILLVSHFPDVLARLEQVAANVATNVPCRAVRARELTSSLAASLRLSESDVLDIVVAERHPLPSIDDRLEEFAEEVPCRCRFTHHIALDDAVMKVFAGDWVASTLRQLGMTEEECIKSEMVSRRIRKAQEKIEGRRFGSLDAQSAEEWLQTNCGDLG